MNQIEILKFTISALRVYKEYILFGLEKDILMFNAV